MSQVNQLTDNYLNGSVQFIKVAKDREDDYFTNFDFLIQKIYEDFFKRHFPDILFVGEEDSSFVFDPAFLTDKYFNFELSDVPSLTNSVFDSETKYNLNELALYIDAIDSTKNFIRKNFTPVTNMIGFVKDNSPIVGFLNYFSFDNKGDKLCYFNIPGKGVYSINMQTEEITKIEPVIDEPKEIFKNSKGTTESNDICEAFELNEVNVSGLGNKCIACVLRGGLGLFVEGVGLWDTCAGHAILREAGGDVLYKDGTSIDYSVTDPEDKKANVTRGVTIAATSKETLKSYLDRLNK